MMPNEAMDALAPPITHLTPRSTIPRSCPPWFLDVYGLMTRNRDRAFASQGEHGPHRSAKDPSDLEVCSAENFMDLVKFLPRCWQHPTSDFYERQEDGKMMAMFPRYWAVEGVEEVAESPEEALALYETAGNTWAAIFVDSTRAGAKRGLRQKAYSGGRPLEIPEAEGGGPWFLTWWGLMTRDSNFAFDWLRPEAYGGSDAEGNYYDLPGDHCDWPVLSARTFLDIVKYLPSFRRPSTFERLADGTMKQIRPLYWCVEDIQEVVDSPEKVFVIYKNGPNSMAGIKVDGDEGRAAEYCRNFGGYWVKYET